MQFKTVMLYRIIHDMVAIPTTPFLIPARASRGHSMRFCCPKSIMNALIYSFFPSTVHMWNQLPEYDVSSPSLETFKKRRPLNTLYEYTRDDKKVLGPCTLGMTKSRNCAIISQYSLLCLDAVSQTLFQFAYPFKIESFFLVPQLLINSIYDTFTASKIPTTKLVFRSGNREKSEGAKSGEYGGLRRTLTLQLVAAAIATRGVGWCITLQEQNTSGQLSSSFLHNLLTQSP